MSPAGFDISNRRGADEHRGCASQGTPGAPARRPTSKPTCARSESRLRASPTALSALDLDDALVICDTLNRTIGYDRNAWTAMAAAAMHAEDGDPGSGPWH